MVRVRARHNMKAVIRALRRARDVSPAYMAVRGAVRAEIRRALTSEGRSTREPFRPNTAAYRAKKLRQGFSGKTMTRTGRTLASVDSGIEFRISADRMQIIWTGNEGVAIAQKATGRRFFRMTPGMATAIMNALEKHVRWHISQIPGV